VRQERHRFCGPGEGRHDAVAEAFDDPALAGVDGAAHQPVVDATRLLGGILAHTGAELSRPDQVGEEHDGGRSEVPAQRAHEPPSYAPAFTDIPPSPPA
jgi:hypothetical protein